MSAEARLHRGRFKSLEDIANRGMRRCAAPLQTEGCVQPMAVDVDERDDAATRVAARHDGKDGEQQHIGQPILASLRPTRIGNICQQIQQRRECTQGNLGSKCHPKSQTFFNSGTLYLSAAHFHPTLLHRGLRSTPNAALNSLAPLPNLMNDSGD
jgi:hypothetical protein